MNIVVFEDRAVTNLYPITIGRPAYAISCASYRLIDWLPSLGRNLVSLVRPHLQMIQLLDYPVFEQQIDPQSPWTLTVNARLVPSVSNIRQLKNFATSNSDHGVRVALDASEIGAALIPTRQLVGKSNAELLATLENLASAEGGLVERVDVGLQLFQYPHDVIRCNLECFDASLQHRIEQGGYREIIDGVFVAGDVAFSDYVVTETKAGPIVIDQQTSIGPFCLLRGPVYVGPRVRINEHTAIKDAVSLAHTTKIGGEVEGSVIEAYTNKQHHGFLGHSYLGSWINLGAGTCNSDLKNTYGAVNMEYHGQKVPTGMQFVGSVIGDYAKTAINTGIFTGKTIGACSMVYGFVTTNVPSFVNYARSFGQITELPAAVMESTQQRMFGRRNVHQRPSDIQLIRDMYDLTVSERQLSDDRLVL